MITICTNNETLRPTLIDALIATGLTVEWAEQIAEVDEDAIWTDVHRAAYGGLVHNDIVSALNNSECNDRFRDWNGGRFCQSGHRYRIVHSDKSMAEARAANDLIDAALDTVVEAWPIDAE